MTNTERIEQIYKCWLNCVDATERIKLHDLPIEDREDAFYCDLAFGTGGLRGKLGLGSNRMNIYTVGKATQGLADYLNDNYENACVALCRDTRHGGKKFVQRVAEVLAGNGIKSYLYERVEPTPALSFAVRELGCQAGVNITASHNPAEYNGYKVYGSDGCQITVDIAKEIQSAIDGLDPFSDVKTLPFEEAQAKGLINWMPEQVLDRYIEETLKNSTGEDCSSLRIVYSPLHGVGLECASRVLKAIHVAEVVTVDEQCIQDGDFPTCPYPNPEIREALELGLKYCDQVKPDLLLATDPDSDRVGIAVPHEGEYKLLSGNEVGLLLLDFLAEKATIFDKDISNKVACTTIVSAPMADDLAEKRGFELRRTLTGFKFIGEQIGLLEQQGREADFLIGFEESYGYLAGTSVRDKDAVVASMLICELATYWKARNKNLYEAMQGLYSEYAFWANALLSQVYEGSQGAENMTAIMGGLRVNTPAEFGGLAVDKIVDYAVGVAMPIINASESQMLPPADVIELRFVDGSRVIFRPSGTEPKAKAYIFAKGNSHEETESKLSTLSSAAKAILEGEK